MASAEAPAAAERVALPPPKCGASSAGHASLVSFARSQSGSTLSQPVFGAPSRLGAAENTFPSAPPDGLFDFERASAAVERERDEVKIKHGEEVGKELLFGPSAPVANTKRRRRQRRAVPKRMREPLSVDALTGLFGGLRGPAEEAGKSGNENETALVQRLAALDVQKRRRKCADSPASGHVEEGNEKRKEESVVDVSKGQDVEGDDPDGVANELSFLVEKCDIKLQEKETGFMPYIV